MNANHNAEMPKLKRSVRRTAPPCRMAHLLGCALAVGLGLLVAGCGGSASSGGERKVLFYQSAMHPWIKSDKPGRCTICGMELTPVYEGELGLAVGGDVLTLSDSTIRVLNVQTVEVRVQPLRQTLTVAGIVDDDDARHRVLAAYLPGRLEALHVSYVGAEVRQGEPLADFYSAALLQAEREYRTVARTADPEALTAIASRLRQMGLTPEQIAALPDKAGETLTSQILAPVSGTVVERFVYAGQYVQEGEKLFELADFSTMWFQFDAYEMDLPWLKPGLSVDVFTTSQPGRTFPGKITFIDPNFSASTRSTKVRVELDNPVVEGRRLLAHRIYAAGRVHLEASEVLAVPRSAILQTGPEAVAFVDEGGGGYARRVVQLGRRGDDLIEVLGGLEAGEMVVVNGNLLMDGQAEMNRAFAVTDSAATLPPDDLAIPGLAANQRQALDDLIAAVDAVTAALAADDLDGFNEAASRVHAATGELSVAFPDTEPWAELLAGVRSHGHLVGGTALRDARKAFHPLSQATAALVLSLRRADDHFSGVKVFRCPMTKDAFPGAPNRADWIQLKTAVRNPYYGAEMLDCGSEVRP